jgi:hypothetical protein
VATHCTGRPPDGSHYYGAWGDEPEKIWADGVAATYDTMPPIMLPDPRDVGIRELEAKLASFEDAAGNGSRRTGAETD